MVDGKGSTTRQVASRTDNIYQSLKHANPITSLIESERYVETQGLVCLAAGMHTRTGAGIYVCPCLVPKHVLCLESLCPFQLIDGKHFFLTLSK